MDSLKEQRIAVKFCVKLWISATETFSMFNTAYSDVATKNTACFKWHERFKGGRQSIDDDERPGRLSTSTDDPHVDKINTLAHIHIKIDFTMELEKNNKLSFLNLLLIKEENGKIGYMVIWKNTHTNRYLNANSRHYPTQLTGVIKILLCVPDQLLTTNTKQKRKTKSPIHL